MKLFLNIIDKLSFFLIDGNAFQLCLPIVRCLLSALIVQWENLRGEDRAKTYLKQLTLSTNLIILLKKVKNFLSLLIFNNIFNF